MDHSHFHPFVGCEVCRHAGFTPRTGEKVGWPDLVDWLEQWFRDGLIFRAHILLDHSILGLRVVEKKKKIDVSRARRSVGLWDSYEEAGFMIHTHSLSGGESEGGGGGVATLSRSRSLSLSLTHSLSLCHKHTHTHTVSLSLTNTLSLTSGAGLGVA